MPCSIVEITDASEEHIAFIFRVEKQAKQAARREVTPQMSTWGSFSRSKVNRLPQSSSEVENTWNNTSASLLRNFNLNLFLKE
jgi:hypothetical protein